MTRILAITSQCSVVKSSYCQAVLTAMAEEGKKTENTPLLHSQDSSNIDEEPQPNQQAEANTIEMDEKNSVPSSSTKKTSPTICSVYIALFILVELLLLTRGGLLVARYAIKGLHCNTSAIPIHKDREYLFTTAVFAIVSILRVLEFGALGYGIHKYKSWSEFCEKLPNVRKCVSWKGVWWSVLLVVYALLGVAVPVVGVLQETEYAEDIHCPEHNRAIYYTYCAINSVRYLLGFGARVLLICTMIKIRTIWFPEGEPDNITNKLKEPSNEAVDIIKDWECTSSYHGEILREYISKGKQVQELINVFQVWFLFPWLAYMLVSSLQTYNLVKPWDNRLDRQEDTWDLPTIQLLLYQCNQLVTILIPYMCGQSINSSHHKYYAWMRWNQLHKFSAHPSRLTMAQMQVIKKDEDYDFVPRLLGTSIKVRMNSPLYVMVLLLGVFFPVIGTVLQRT